MTTGTSTETTIAEVTSLGRSAAEAVIGAGVVDEVVVRAGEDSSGDPAYRFYFRIRADAEQPTTLAYVRLSQQIRDDLLAIRDEHYPYVTLLGHADWSRIERALAF